MKLTITATDTITLFEGVRTRVWEGETERGIPCKVLVQRIIVDEKQDCTDFDRELRECMPPVVNELPLSMIL